MKIKRFDMKSRFEGHSRLKPWVGKCLLTHGFNRGTILKNLIFFLFLLFSNSNYGQVGIHFDKIELDKKENELVLGFGSMPMFIFTKKLTENTTREFTPPPIPKVYAYCDLALFCKVEVKIEKALKRNFKFCLGTLDYVNRLEQKY